MSVLLFLVILAALVFVHELGHFLAAKLSRIRVDEFALGFPPKLFSFRYGETTYAINLIPFGGYVKIFGENPDEESLRGPESGRSFVTRPRYIQALVLVAGIVMNIVFAWGLISTSLVLGYPVSQDFDIPGGQSQNSVVVAALSPEGPAARAGILPGDTLVEIRNGRGREALQPSVPDVLPRPQEVEPVQEFIANHGGQPLVISVLRHGKEIELSVVPESGLVEGKYAIGVVLAPIHVVTLPVHMALVQGAVLTARSTAETAAGLSQFLSQAVTGRANFSDVTGPVGIVSLVGDASHFGLSYLLGFTAFISINLAIINLLPFPALDGGRLFVVALEAIIRRRFNPKWMNMINAVGFVILIGLMLLITYHDVTRLLF